jgi:hypothetical protein
MCLLTVLALLPVRIQMTLITCYERLKTHRREKESSMRDWIPTVLATFREKSGLKLWLIWFATSAWLTALCARGRGVWLEIDVRMKSMMAKRPLSSGDKSKGQRRLPITCEKDAEKMSCVCLNLLYDTPSSSSFFFDHVLLFPSPCSCHPCLSSSPVFVIKTMHVIPALLTNHSINLHQSPSIASLPLPLPSPNNSHSPLERRKQTPRLHGPTQDAKRHQKHPTRRQDSSKQDPIRLYRVRDAQVCRHVFGHEGQRKKEYGCFADEESHSSEAVYAC